MTIHHDEISYINDAVFIALFLEHLYVWAMLGTWFLIRTFDVLQCQKYVEIKHCVGAKAKCVMN